MRRHAANHIKKYNALLSSDPGKSTFNASDFIEIKSISSDLYEAIENALKVGYVVGYNRAKKEARQ